MINSRLKDNMKSFFNFLANYLSASFFVCNKNLRKIYFVCVQIIWGCSFFPIFDIRNHQFVFITVSNYVRFFDHGWSGVNCDKRITSLITTMWCRSPLSTYKNHVPHCTLVFIEITITIKKLLLTTRTYLTRNSNISHKASTCICSSKLTFIDSK